MEEEYFDINIKWVRPDQYTLMQPKKKKNASAVKATSNGLKSNIEECVGTYMLPHAHKQSSTHAKEHMLNHHWSFPGNKKAPVD